MPRRLALALLLAACGRPAPAQHTPPPPAPVASSPVPPSSAHALIESLADVSDEGLGYSGAYAGTDFLPYAGSGQPGVLLLQRPPPVPSAALRSLVDMGAVAVPSLVECLSDARPTHVPPVRALMWTSYADEMDWSPRTDAAPPSTVNRDDSAAEPAPYQVTVGDLCFVALGQIVNRAWDAVRYQPSGGIVISSPSRSPALRRAVEDDLHGFTTARHREGLVRDFREPDYESRREGAALRLARYYPQALEDPVVELLARPSYDVFAVERFARQVLYREPSPERRRDLFDRFVGEQGPAARAGLLLQLYDDLGTLEADEQHRLSPPLTEYHTQPRELLVSLYGLPADVASKSRPYVDYVSTSELTRTVELLIHDASPRIDAAVRALRSATRDADLAKACDKRFAR
jgi:hypothetical protein